MVDISTLLKFGVSDPGFASAINMFMDNRSASSVCWVMALDEVTAGCLADAAATNVDRSNGLITLWPVDITGLTLTSYRDELRRSTTKLNPVDVSTPDRALKLINSARRLLNAGDALVVCGNALSCPEFLRRELLARCDAWGVVTVWGGPDESLPQTGEACLVIPEIPLAATGCTSSRTSDFLYDLALRLAKVNSAEVAPRDRDDWCASMLNEKQRAVGELQEDPDDEGIANVRTACATIPMNFAHLPQARRWDLVTIDGKTREPLSIVTL